MAHHQLRLLASLWSCRLAAAYCAEQGPAPKEGSRWLLLLLHLSPWTAVLGLLCWCPQLASQLRQWGWLSPAAGAGVVLEPLEALRGQVQGAALLLGVLWVVVKVVEVLLQVSPPSPVAWCFEVL